MSGQVIAGAEKFGSDICPLCLALWADHDDYDQVWEHSRRYSVMVSEEKRQRVMARAPMPLTREQGAVALVSRELHRRGLGARAAGCAENIVSALKLEGYLCS